MRAVTDYIVGNEDTREGVERMEVGDRVASDHHPVVVWLRWKGGGSGKRRRKKVLVGG